jgi:acetate kinase
LPLPRAFQSDGLRRYGFHGLAYAHALEELGRRDPPLARAKLVLAHLGNGCSLAAVEDGASRDTTMGFSPVSGIMMGTRSGDLDPGLVRWLARERGFDADAFHELAHERCGLLGVSETSSDVRDLLARENDDPRAAEALELFCHGVRKAIGAFAAVLGGLDGLCFSGGIGENSPVLRARICERLGHLGVELDPRLNAANAERISAGRVRVHRVVADEALQIARATARVLDGARLSG